MVSDSSVKCEVAQLMERSKHELDMVRVMCARPSQHSDRTLIEKLHYSLDSLHSAVTLLLSEESNAKPEP
jgi:hypothetical protein